MQHVVPEGFVPYVPEVFNGNGKNSAVQRDENAATGPTVHECNQARLLRIRNKEKLKASRTVRVRVTGKSPPSVSMRTYGACVKGPSATGTPTKARPVSTICLKGMAARRVYAAADADGNNTVMAADASGSGIMVSVKEGPAPPVANPIPSSSHDPGVAPTNDAKKKSCGAAGNLEKRMLTERALLRVIPEGRSRWSAS